MLPSKKFYKIDLSMASTRRRRNVSRIRNRTVPTRWFREPTSPGAWAIKIIKILFTKDTLPDPPNGLPLNKDEARAGKIVEQW